MSKKNGGLSVVITYKKVPDFVLLNDDTLINRTLLAEELTKRTGRKISKQIVSYWMITGKFPLDMIPHLKEIPLPLVQNRIWSQPRKGDSRRGRKPAAK